MKLIIHKQLLNYVKNMNWTFDIVLENNIRQSKVWALNKKQDANLVPVVIFYVDGNITALDEVAECLVQAATEKSRMAIFHDMSFADMVYGKSLEEMSLTFAALGY